MCEVGVLIRQCGAATPGLQKMYLIDVDDVVTIPAPDSNWTVTSDIVLQSGAGFKDIPFAEQKAGFIDDIADAVSGGFQKQIPLKLAKYSPETNQWINNLIGARFIAVLADSNGQMILVGSTVYPLRLEKAKGATGTKFGEENGWDINIIGEGAKPCYFYTGTIVIDSGLTPSGALIDDDGEVLIDDDGEILIDA